MARWLEAALFSLEEVGMRVQIPGQLSFFFSFIVFLSFGFLLFILTADPFSFARFLRKRISSNIIILSTKASKTSICRHVLKIAAGGVNNRRTIFESSFYFAAASNGTTSQFCKRSKGILFTF